MKRETEKKVIDVRSSPKTGNHRAANGYYFINGKKSSLVQTEQKYRNEERRDTRREKKCSCKEMWFSSCQFVHSQWHTWKWPQTQIYSIRHKYMPHDKHIHSHLSLSISFFLSLSLACLSTFHKFVHSKSICISIQSAISNYKTMMKALTTLISWSKFSNLLFHSFCFVARQFRHIKHFYGVSFWQLYTFILSVSVCFLLWGFPQQLHRYL